DAELLDGGGPQIRPFADGHQGHESAIGAAGDADFLRVHIACGHHEVRARHFVLQVAAAQVLDVGVLEVHSVAGGAADVGGDHQVAAGNQGDHAAAERIERLARGTAMRQHDAGTGGVALEVVGHPEEGADHSSVKALVMHQVRRGNLGGLQTADGGKAELAGALRPNVIYPEIG